MIKIDINIRDGQEILTMSRWLNVAQAKEIIDFYVMNELEVTEEDTRVDHAIDNMPRSQLNKLIREAGEDLDQQN